MRLHRLTGQALHAHNETNTEQVQRTPFNSYRHRYRCWLCKGEGVLEFEPDALPSWTECHHCGIDNEIPPGLHDRPAVIQGHVPGRII
jgi:hypothetical protein